MLGQTHMIAGALAAAWALHATGAPLTYLVPGLALGAVGALVPDLDSPGSTASRAVPGYRGLMEGTLPTVMAALAGVFWFLPRTGTFAEIIPGNLWMLFAAAAALGWVASVGLRNILTHRGPTHSLAALAAFTVGVRYLWPTLPKPLLWALAAGYASHILIDLFNPQGVAILWPLTTRKWSVKDSPLLLPLHPLVVRTGGPGEMWGWRPILMAALVGTLIVQVGADFQFLLGRG